MKLSFFNNETMPKNPSSRNIRPAISFGKSGLISLNKAASELMELSLNDKVSFAQDEEDPSNWYLYKDNINGFEVRSKEFEKNGTLAFNHNNFRVSFLKSFDLDTEISHRFLLGGVPTKVGKQFFYGILVGQEALAEGE